jgi:F-type H+-transporting ATPase subunit epsilon
VADLQVNLVTPERLAWSGVASEVRVPGWEGEFDVLPGHDVVLSLLRAGILTLTESGLERRFLIGRGFVEVTPASITVLTDRVEDPTTTDKRGALEDLHAAELRMAEVGSIGGEWASLEERRERSLAILGT